MKPMKPTKPIKPMKTNKQINPIKIKKTKNILNNKKQNNVRKTTKNVFEQLIKSFGRIGDEAEKDSKLLKKATRHLV